MYHEMSKLSNSCNSYLCFFVCPGRAAWPTSGKSGVAHKQDVGPEPDASSAARGCYAGAMKMRASAHNRSREMFSAIMIGVASAAVLRFNKKSNTLVEQSNVRGLGGRAERLGILTEFTCHG